MSSGLIYCDITVSLDGFVAGLDQSLEHPLGKGGDRLHRWMFEGAAENAAELAAMSAQKAFIIGRNMFGPGRGKWDLSWKGWWGEEPPYHAPVFVLTHHPRDPLVMKGTTFFFVTDGIESALRQAQQAASGGSIGVQGGANVVRQYLQAGLIDELRLRIAPVIIGHGESLFAGLEDLKLEALSARHTSLVTHIQYRVVK